MPNIKTIVDEGLHLRTYLVDNRKAQNVKLVRQAE